jgi:hypothetical protein
VIQRTLPYKNDKEWPKTNSSNFKIDALLNIGYVVTSKENWKATLLAESSSSLLKSNPSLPLLHSDCEQWQTTQALSTWLWNFTAPCIWPLIWCLHKKRLKLLFYPIPPKAFQLISQLLFCSSWAKSLDSAKFKATLNGMALSRNLGPNGILIEFYNLFWKVWGKLY